MPFHRPPKFPTLVGFTRALDWIGRALTANQDAFTMPSAFWDTVSPTVDAFGSSRINEIQFAQVNGALAGIETLHTRVPADRQRLYLAMEWSHDDIGFLRPTRSVRVLTTDQMLFPAVGIQDQHTAAIAQEVFAVRNVVVPPLGWIGVRTTGLGVGARNVIRVIWAEYPVGEYPLGIR